MALRERLIAGGAGPNALKIADFREFMSAET